MTVIFYAQFISSVNIQTHYPPVCKSSDSLIDYFYIARTNFLFSF